MKIRILTLCFLFICSSVFAAGITDKLKSVVSRMNVASGGDTYIALWNGDDCSGDRYDSSTAGGSCDIAGTQTATGTAVTTNNPCGGSTYAMEINGASNNYVSWPLTYDVSSLDGSIFIQFDINISVDNDGNQTLLHWEGNADNRFELWVAADGTLAGGYREAGANNYFYSTTAITNSGCRQIQIKCDPTAGSNEVGFRVCNDGTCDAESWEYDTDSISKWAVNLTSLEMGEGLGGKNDITGTYHIDNLKVWDNADQN